MSDEREIRKANDERLEALVAGDAGRLEQLLADELSSTTATGHVQSKAEVLADVTSGQLKVIASDAQEFKARIYGDTAVATYRAVIEATYEGRSRSGQYRATSVYVKRDGRWKLVAQQNTLLPAAQPPAAPGAAG
jgi:uncharacterized protein (TIGR02246 family)